MPEYIEMSINGVIHESEIFGAAAPSEDEE